MDVPLTIYCADGNKRFAEIATRQGYTYGACLPNTVYLPPAFTDQDWRKFNAAKTSILRTKCRADYFAVVKRFKPQLATVLDWEREEQLPEVLSWAEEAAQYVQEAVIIIPKVVGGIKRLPKWIGGKQVRLGYSASSSFSSTPVPLDDFRGYPTHCLGGSVATQFMVSRVTGALSADGNYLQRMATKYCQVYSPSIPDIRRYGWPRLSVFCGYKAHESPYIAFELSCIGVQMAWRGYKGTDIYEAQIAWLNAAGLAPSMKQSRLI